jgi:hypothetical protein
VFLLNYFEKNKARGQDCGYFLKGQRKQSLNRCLKPGMVAYVCNPSHSGGGDKRTAVQGHPGKSWRPYLKSKLTVKE